MHLLKNSFKITEKATRISFEKPLFTCKSHYVCQCYTLLVYSAFLWPILKIALCMVLSNSFKLARYYVESNYLFDTNPLCQFVRQSSPITASNVSKVHKLIDMVAAHDFYIKEPTI